MGKKIDTEVTKKRVTGYISIRSIYFLTRVLKSTEIVVSLGTEKQITHMLITVLSYLAKLVYIVFTGISLRRSTEEREYYSDTLEVLNEKKYHKLLDIKGWVPEVSRSVIELIFIFLVIIPTFFSWNFVFVPLYLAAVYFIYKNRTGRFFNRNEVFKLNIARILFILLTFIF